MQRHVLNSLSPRLCIPFRCQVLYDKVKATVREQLQELLEYREQDGQNSVASRLRRTVSQLWPVWQEGCSTGLADQLDTPTQQRQP